MFLKDVTLGALEDSNEKIDSTVRQVNDWASQLNTEETGGWNTWAVTNRNNITVGNGSETARFKIVRGICFFRYTLSVGSTTSIGATQVRIGLPTRVSTALYGSIVYPAIGLVSYYDSGSATMYPGLTILTKALTGDSTVEAFWHDGSGGATSTFPVTEASGDQLHIEGYYEIAE